MILTNLYNGLAPLGMICQVKKYGSFDGKHFIVVTNYNSLVQDQYVVPAKTEADAEAAVKQLRGRYVVVQLHQSTINLSPVVPYCE